MILEQTVFRSISQGFELDVDGKEQDVIRALKRRLEFYLETSSSRESDEKGLQHCFPIKSSFGCSFNTEVYSSYSIKYANLTCSAQ